MKRTQLLNRHLSALVASLGHLDEIVVADAGLPVPDGVQVIDLAVSPGVPRFHDVLDALRSELVIEQAIWAEEASETLAGVMQAEVDFWRDQTGKPVDTSKLPHEAFKQRSASAEAIIRTGETTPYANIILVSGVAF
ncbi:D-ribose pyranase [Roseibium sediminicola]|uniref:D-ribose pyranase n=1 Tax=Roseibium sediminicola TaxID=2933272 RepID=A0ABT0GQP9_9HYPH|nr:D-ribose pyranase [Roseibium sp. CAU 1639]MCK7611769.1 D-ribose pyranase [Roseibium sp. CAU 1639]